MKYSKQRDLILTYVQNSKSHPTAEMVYSDIKKEIPNISLGTVYRNLNQLCEHNLLRKIVVPNKVDRFDNVYHHHGHLYCNECGRIEDINQELLEKACKLVEQTSNYQIISNDMVFVGICYECQKRKGK